MFAPFEFNDASNNFVGIDVDLLAAIAEDQGFTYDLQPLGFDAALLAVGRWCDRRYVYYRGKKREI